MIKNLKTKIKYPILHDDIYNDIYYIFHIIILIRIPEMYMEDPSISLYLTAAICSWRIFSSS